MVHFWLISGLFMVHRNVFEVDINVWNRPVSALDKYVYSDIIDVWGSAQDPTAALIAQ